ncbi:MAG: tetratricopeptide repeat protein [Bacteroidales bacterium]|nr:tetratricopeptide repeat protein [Bacteroidales bacterium]MCF8456000.1 tetratricopeptide repeat protein [Bacteroidales bacterium]
MKETEFEIPNITLKYLLFLRFESDKYEVMFGGGAGHILDMIIRLRNNKAMLRKKSMFKKEKSFLNLNNDDFPTSKGKIRIVSATKEQLDKIRIVAREDQRKFRLAFLLVVSTTLVLLIILLNTYNNATRKPTEENMLEMENDIQLKKKLDFDFFISDGDRWFTQGQWHNAIFQYKKALEVFPNDYDASFRLARTYTYCCEREKENCKEAVQLIDKLLLAFPEDSNIVDLKEHYHFIHEVDISE